jgi:hypothetical protein
MRRLQRTVKTAYLTTLTRLHVTGQHFAVGRKSTLPPNLISPTVPTLLHAKPILQLTRLQHLAVDNLNHLSTAGLADIASLTQLTSMDIGLLYIHNAEAPEVMSALAAMPLKSLGVVPYGQAPGAVDGDMHPAHTATVVGSMLSQLTGLTSLMVAMGWYAWSDLAASLAHLTGLQELVLQCDGGDGFAYDDTGVSGNMEDCESFASTIVGLEQLRSLKAIAGWFGGWGAEDGQHPIMRLQAATQLTFLDLFDLHTAGGKPCTQAPAWPELLQSLPGIKLGASWLCCGTFDSCNAAQ